MRHVPIEDVLELWDETPQRDWSALHETLERHRGRAKGPFDDEEIHMLLPITARLAQIDRPYPDSPEGLHSMLNDEIRASR